MRKHKILIVDDVPENIRLLGDALKSYYEVCLSLNGEKALKIARSENSPDLILLDIVMPGIDGYEVCRLLKNDSKTKDIPVIFISANSGDENETLGFELGAVDYIRKPFNLPVVKARVRAHLELKERTEMLQKEVLERSRIDRQLRRTTEYLENVFESSAEAISIWDGKNACIKWNKMSEELFGFCSGDMAGRDFSSLFSERDEYEKIKTVLLEEGMVRKYETNMQKKDGNNFPCEISLAVLQNDGEVIGSVFIGRDLTEMKFVQIEHQMVNDILKIEIENRIKMEAELKEAKEHLENVFENSAEAICINDKHGRCVSWNKMAQELFGYCSQEMKGERTFDLYSDKEELDGMLKRLRADGFVKRHQIRMKKKDGLNFPCEVSVGLLKDGKGQTTGSVFVGRDLSELMITQAELSMINELLKSEIDMRERFELELKQAKEDIEKAFENADRERMIAEEANRKIMESIRYAKTIQASLLPNIEEVKTWLPDSFFIWLPRDLVGGDIFHIEPLEDGFVVALIDCTGHGVPGAFMTMIASSGIRRIIKTEGITDPSSILKRMNSIVKTSLQQDKEHVVSDDGMDAAVCLVEKTGKRLFFSGANMQLFYVLDGELKTVRGDRMSIGYKKSDLGFDFTKHTVDIEKETSFYMASDGFKDQLGGEPKRCFGTKRFKKLLAECSSFPFEERKEMLIRALEGYQDGDERQDDVTVVGFKL